MTARLPILFWVCLVAALLIRLAGFDKGLRSDEVGELMYSSGRLDQIVPSIVESDAHPPLSYLVYHVWTRFGDGDAWMRVPTILLGTIVCALVYFIGRGRVSDATSLTAMWLAAVAPASVLIAQTVRSYAMAAVCVMTAFLALVHLAERGSAAHRTAHLVYGVAAVLALYSFYFSVLPLLVFGVYGCWRWRGQTGLLMRWLVTNSVVALAFAPWLPYMVRQLQRVTEEVPDLGGFYIAGVYLGGTMRGLTGLLGLDDAFLADQRVALEWPRPLLLVTVAAVVPAAAAFAVWGIRALRSQERWAGFAWLVVIAAAGPALMALAAHHLTGIVMTPRYMYTSFLLLAYVVAALVMSVPRPAYRALALAGISLLLLTRDAQLLAWTEVDWKNGGAFLAQNYDAGDLLIHLTDPRVDRYVPDALAALELQPGRVDAIDAATVARAPRVWVAFSGTAYHRHQNEHVAKWLQDHGYGPRSEQSFGTLRILRYERAR